MRNLSKNFTLEEMYASAKADKAGINNIPIDKGVIYSLKALCVNVLQPVRDVFGTVFVSSGYRGEKLNILVGGSANSQHLIGEAADFRCGDITGVFYFIRDNLDFDQLIWERGNNLAPSWIHVSYTMKRRNRREVLYLR